MTTHVGNVLSSDVFYSNYGEKNIELGKWGVKAVEMEAAALYYLAAQHHVDALAIMTISDSLVNPDEDTTAEERQNTFTDMMKVVRNPLAHLIKPFDEEELHRTTGFSSQDFMKNLIDLCKLHRHPL